LKKFEMALQELVAQGEMIHEKTKKNKKSRDTVPLPSAF
jgi:hypothetical protein